MRNRGVWREPSGETFEAALDAATAQSSGFRTLTAIDCSHCRSLKVEAAALFAALRRAPVRVVDLRAGKG